MCSDLTTEENRGVWHDLVAGVIHAMLLAIFLVVYNAVTHETTSHKPACTDIYQHSSSPRTCDE